MSLLLVRKTYWNIPCTQRTLAAGIKHLQKALNAHGRGTPTAAGPYFSLSNWHEYKVATYRGRQVLLVVEIAKRKTDFAAPLPPAISKLMLHQSHCSFRPDNGLKTHSYLLFGYTPFRSQAYNTYQQTRSLAEKNELLAKHLADHLQTLAVRLAFPRKCVLQLNSLRIRKEKRVRIGGILQLSFDLEFTTNLFIPEYLGLGRGAAQGLGVIRLARTRRLGGTA